MSISEESELDELSWKRIHGQKLTEAQETRYRDLYIKEKAERGVAIKPWTIGKLHGATIHPQ